MEFLLGHIFYFRYRNRLERKSENCVRHVVIYTYTCYGVLLGFIIRGTCKPAIKYRIKLCVFYGRSNESRGFRANIFYSYIIYYYARNAIAATTTDSGAKWSLVTTSNQGLFDSFSYSINILKLTNQADFFYHVL